MRLRRPQIVVLATLLLVLMIAGPSAAVEEPPPARALGPLRGITRGTIESVRSVNSGIQVFGTVTDPDALRSIEYQFMVDGEVVTEGRSLRQSTTGSKVRFRNVAPTEPGLHQVCLRVIDPEIGERTTDCQTALALPARRVAGPVRRASQGALLTPTGVLVPIVGGVRNNWEVTTPCGANVRLTEGTVVPHTRVVIDPGHGGSEPGAVGGGLIEKDLNLAVSREVIAQLEELGVDAILTRNADYRIPLRTRAEIANSLAPDMFVSVHHNGGAVRHSPIPGTEIYYGQDEPEGLRFARILYNEMIGELGRFDVDWVSTVNEGTTLRLREQQDDLYGIHRYTPGVNSVISEFIYLSNPSEAAFMARPGSVALEAKTIVDSLVRWWSTTDNPDAPGRTFVNSITSGTGGFGGCTDPDLIG